MNIKELKEILLKLPEEYEVKVQYRDSGGDYYGKDNELRLTIDIKNKVLLL